MKQTITVRDSYSKNLKDVISSDLKGYVEVQVKNSKTGEIEHQENHNLIVYGGREWILKKIFNIGDDIKNSAISWVGFGCGGAEAGNPLQTGVTVGSDADLYQPVRIRFNDETNTTNANQYYASRVLPNGSIVGGYYKQLTSINLKEDHANPYIENNIKKYPTLIAEIRVELSSDDCNGENYTENGNLVAYQDINEAALFISDTTKQDPGTDVNLKKRYTDITGSNKIYNAGVTKTQVPVGTTGASQFLEYDSSNHTWESDAITKSAYKLQYLKTAATEIEAAVYEDVCSDIESFGFAQGEYLKITRISSTVSGYSYSLKFQKSTDGNNWTDITPKWNYNFNVSDPTLRLLACGQYTLNYTNLLTNTSSENCFCTVQYRNNENDPWIDLDTKTLPSTDSTTVYSTVADIEGSGVYHSVSTVSMFRTQQTTIPTKTISIKSVETSEESFIAKYFLDDNISQGCDVDKISAGDLIYTADDPTAADGKTNEIKKSAPLKILSVHKRSTTDNSLVENDKNYFTVEKGNCHTQSYTTGTVTTGINGYSYKPVSSNPYTMFSRVCLSSIRKSSSRELAIVWKIYV